MLRPDEDETDRRPVWNSLQEFWLDTDANLFLQRVAEVCARSKYSIAELEQIFWNEVQPALQFNLRSIAGEWAGFDPAWLAEQILTKHRFGRPLPMRSLHPHENFWWKKLRAEVERLRAQANE